MNLDRFITETVHKQLLVENAINNSWRAARKMVIAKTSCTEEEAEKMVNEISILVGLSYEMVKFIKGCTRMFLNGEFKYQQVLGDFKDALNKIKTDGHIDEFDTNLRRLDQPEGTVNSARDIIGFFKPEIDRERAEQRQKLSGMEFVPNTDYEIVKINSFNEARKYSRYTSWCVTSGRTNYDGYTTNGINQFYFCLQNGFENIENDGDFNDKKDAYALSMLAILVNPEGELIHCTNRKNNDQSVLNPFEISKLLGCNFYETFKPNTMWQDALEGAENKLANGVPIKKVFNEVRREGGLVFVSLSGRWNILGEGNTFLCDHWYTYIFKFSEGFASVLDKGKGWNFINREGKEVSGRWYDFIGEFHEGLADVREDSKGYNFIDSEGKVVFGRWYDSADNFSEGFARVEDVNKGWNFINHEGEELCDRCYDFAYGFSEGFAKVEDKTKGWNFINRDGKEVGNRWYDNVYSFFDGLGMVNDKDKGFNFINRDGKEICDRWYDDVRNSSEGFAAVKDKNKGWNFVNRKGKEICDRWYDDVGYFHKGFVEVYDATKGYNFINRDGKEISDRWYDDVCVFSKGFAVVKYKEKRYRLRKDGVLCDYRTKKPIEDGPTQMAESLINRLVRDILFENKLKKKKKK